LQKFHVKGDIHETHNPYCVRIVVLRYRDSSIFSPPGAGILVFPSKAETQTDTKTNAETKTNTKTNAETSRLYGNRE